MIEIICRENQQEEQEVKVPKNIRQVGSPRGRHKIYMEDYVYTYLRNQAQANRKSAAVLVGKSCVSRDMRYTFISGAIECGQAIFQFDSIYLDESFWEYIDTENKESFPDTDIVGWFVGEQGEGLALSPSIESAHRKYFAGRDKILMLMDMQEEEELFYIYEQGYLQKREGYYIYYEKNLAMQEYMIKRREQQEEILWRNSEPEEKEESLVESFGEPQENFMAEISGKNQQKSIDGKFPEKWEEEAEWEALHKEMRQEPKIFVKSSIEEPESETEKALQRYRDTLLEKRGHKVERQNKKFTYTAASVFMIAFCIVGITTINNYHKMKEVEETLQVMESETEENEDTDLVVESVASEVEPLEDGQTQQQAAEQQSMEQQLTDQQTAISEQEVAQQPTTSDQTDQQAATPQQSTGQQTTDQQTAAQQTAGQSTEPQYYTVQAGDTLESICLKIYQDKSMVAALCQANGITDGNQIQAGQQLLLP